ncbi:MAG: PEP-CTERM sorting domain-containing protein [Bryobacterales bacterium]|nr:PEP-CTERM sorting domain-containing protein [Bryobacterales bacterium]
MQRTLSVKIQYSLCAGALLLSLFTAHAGAASIVSDFDNAGNGLDGWTVIGDPVGGAATYQATGGNPGGFAQVSDNGAGAVIYWAAPSKFHGNLSSYLGGTLRFDMSQSPLANLFLATLGDIQLVSPGLTLVTEVFSNANLPTLAFQTETVSLSTSTAWRVGTTGGALATASDLQTVLGNVTGILIRGEISLLIDTNGLDNVVLEQNVPEPSTAALLLAGLAAAFAFRKRVSH